MGPGQLFHGRSIHVQTSTMICNQEAKRNAMSETESVPACQRQELLPGTRVDLGAVSSSQRRWKAPVKLETDTLTNVAFCGYKGPSASHLDARLPGTRLPST